MLKFKLETKGININWKNLNHLRFADDMILFADNEDDLQMMVTELEETSKKIGMKVNWTKTKTIGLKNLQITINETIPKNVNIKRIIISMGQIVT